MTSSSEPPKEPPYHAWRYRGNWNRGDWQHRRGFLIRRFARFLLVGLGLFLAGTAAIVYLVSRVLGGLPQHSALIWLLSAGLVLSFPILLGIFALRTFFRAVNPLARVMAAADQVADGDLNVQVPEVGPPEFARLAHSFNHMVQELRRLDKLR